MYQSESTQLTRVKQIAFRYLANTFAIVIHFCDTQYKQKNHVLFRVITAETAYEREKKASHINPTRTHTLTHSPPANQFSCNSQRNGTNCVCTSVHRTRKIRTAEHQTSNRAAQSVRRNSCVLCKFCFAAALIRRLFVLLPFFSLRIHSNRNFGSFFYVSRACVSVCMVYNIGENIK